MEHVDLHDAAALEHLTLLEQVRIERMQRIDRTEEEANTSHLESTFANLLCCIPDRCWMTSAQKALVESGLDQLFFYEYARRFHLWRDWRELKLLRRRQTGVEAFTPEWRRPAVSNFMVRKHCRQAFEKWRVKRFIALTNKTKHLRGMVHAIKGWKALVRRRREQREREAEAARNWWAGENMRERRRARAKMRRWHERAAPNADLLRATRELHQTLGHPEWRAQRQLFEHWFEHLRVIAEWKRDLNAAVDKFEPRRRRLLLGFEKFSMRAPRWLNLHMQPVTIKMNSQKLQVSHSLDRGRSSAIGSPIIRGVYTFAFLVRGGGKGVVVGVTTRAHSEKERESAAKWGLHLTHGCLFTKLGEQEGTLSNVSIAPSLAELPAGRPIQVVVEVDVPRRRLAFGVDGGPVKQADVELPDGFGTQFRPWAFLWGANDKVALLPREQHRRPQMATREKRTSLVKQQKLVSARVAAQRHVSIIDSPSSSPEKQQQRSPLKGSARSSPSSSPPRSPPSVYLRDSPTSKSARSTARTQTPKTVSARTPPPQTSSARFGQHDEEEEPPQSPERWVGEEEAARAHGERSSSPLPAPPLTPAKQKKAEQPHLFQFALGLFEERQSGSPRAGKSSMWDMAKRVSGLYTDTYSQLRK